MKSSMTKTTHGGVIIFATCLPQAGIPPRAPDSYRGYRYGKSYGL